MVENGAAPHQLSPLVWSLGSTRPILHAQGWPVSGGGSLIEMSISTRVLWHTTILTYYMCHNTDIVRQSDHGWLGCPEGGSCKRCNMSTQNWKWKSCEGEIKSSRIKYQSLVYLCALVTTQHDSEQSGTIETMARYLRVWATYHPPMLLRETFKHKRAYELKDTANMRTQEWINPENYLIILISSTISNFFDDFPPFNSKGCSFQYIESLMKLNWVAITPYLDAMTWR